MDQIICWADMHPGFLNAVLSTILIIVTGMYVYLTNKMLHTPHMPNLAFSFKTEGFGSSIITELTVYCKGPGAAYNVAIEYTNPSNRKLVSPAPIIEPKCEYPFNIHIDSSEWPFYLSFNTASGKYIHRGYKIKDGFRLIRLGRIKRLYYFIKGLMDKNRSPIFRRFKAKKSVGDTN